MSNHKLKLVQFCPGWMLAMAPQQVLLLELLLVEFVQFVAVEWGVGLVSELVIMYECNMKKEGSGCNNFNVNARSTMNRDLWNV